MCVCVCVYVCVCVCVCVVCVCVCVWCVCVCVYTIAAQDPTKHRGKSTLLTSVMQHAHVYISTCTLNMCSVLATCWLKLAVAKNSILVRLKYICGRW